MLCLEDGSGIFLRSFARIYQTARCDVPKHRKHHIPRISYREMKQYPLPTGYNLFY